MGYEKFTWVIQNFSYLQYLQCSQSNIFVIGGCKWFLKGYHDAKYLSLYLEVANYKTLPCGWRRHTRFRLTVVNQLSDELSQQREMEKWFDQKLFLSGYQMLLLTKLIAKKGGFLVNNEVKIVVEVDVLQVIGNLDVSEESLEVNQPMKRIKLNDDGASVKESIDVNGFLVLPSQVTSS
ncbi:hypothetical protein AXX17_AT3G38570 [Arabidopsis thaliana]|uniref:MATH domain-containing protein n=1 Tax=Arabidopsis thaliana TaxID=3702 RepID=A0A178VLR5_ARATH|nr:hypothetical protein AXX17_AT3G38570 [Arabidopsis thaliana]